MALMDCETYDRKANRRELANARTRMKKANGGPGIVVAARRLGIGHGQLSLALRGELRAPIQRLTIRQLRQMFEESEEDAVAQ